MKRRALHQRNETTFSIRRGLAFLLLLSQTLFSLFSISHVCAIRSTSGFNSVATSDGVSVGVSDGDATAHDPATCVICLAQNTDRGLAATPPALGVTSVAEVPTATEPRHVVPSRPTALPRSRAPPSLT